MEKFEPYSEGSRIIWKIEFKKKKLIKVAPAFVVFLEFQPEKTLQMNK